VGSEKGEKVGGDDAADIPSGCGALLTDVDSEAPLMIEDHELPLLNCTVLRLDRVDVRLWFLCLFV
jgi:hypothetical protein